MSYWRALFLVWFLNGFAGFAQAQNFFKTPCFTAQGYVGSFLTNLPKAQLLRDSYSYWGELSIYQKTNGIKAWQQANGLPHIGMAVFFGNTGSKKYLGNMAGIFPFIRWNIYTHQAFATGLRAGAGIGFVQKPYDKITNHKNALIGTHANAYLNLLWQTQVQLFSNIHATAGIGFSHFSNGSSTLPNLGLNIPAFALGLSYVPASAPVSIPTNTDSIYKKNSFAVFTSAGIKQAPWIESKRYLVNMIQGEWRRRFSRVGSYSAGLALFYDRSLEVNAAGILDEKYTGLKLQTGVYAGYEHHLGRLSIPLSAGAYVYNPKGGTTLFQQVGFRYRLKQQWLAQLAMKTHAGKADFIHLGFGCWLR